MNTKTVKKVIEQETMIYVADDGREFTSETECKQYEEKIIFNNKIEAAEKLRITELDEMIPLSDDGGINENNTFRWYRVENETDFDVLNEAYGNSLCRPSIYPEVICVETIGYEAYMDDAYSYNMTTCKYITESFWNKLGYKVTFEEK